MQEKEGKPKPTSFPRQSKLGRRPRSKQRREHQRTRRTCRLRIQRGDLVHHTDTTDTTRASEYAREDGVEVRPERLGVCQGSVDPRDERSAP